MPIRQTRPYRAGLITTAVLTVGIALPASAQAHVRVTPDEVPAGGYATVSFKVPNESESASTTKLEIDLPTDAPFGSVSYQPVPGWKTEVTTTKLPKPIKTPDGTVTEAPTRVTWTASGDAAIKPGQFQVFPLSAGPVPSKPSVKFVARQTYSDGKVVAWNQDEKNGQEPENPAPVLKIGGSSGSSDGSAPAPAAPSSKGSTHDTGAMWLASGAVALGAAALVTAAWAATRRK